MSKLQTLFPRDIIEESIKILAKQIEDDYRDIIEPYEPIICVCVLKGAFMFFSDLIKELHLATYPEFIQLKSYEGEKSTGVIQLLHDTTGPVSGKHVLIIEDIVDSGRTVQFLRKYFSAAKSVKVAALLDKPMSREVEAKVDYTAITLARPTFVVGYGLDYDQKYRGCSEILEVLEP